MKTVQGSSAPVISEMKSAPPLSASIAPPKVSRPEDTYSPQQKAAAPAGPSSGSGQAAGPQGPSGSATPAPAGPSPGPSQAAGPQGTRGSTAPAPEAAPAKKSLIKKGISLIKKTLSRLIGLIKQIAQKIFKRAKP